MHYHRWRRHGDPTGGRAPNGEPERYFHEVALTYDGDECLIWPYARNEQGYAVMRSVGGSAIVSRRICEETHGPAPSLDLDAAHSCGKGEQGCIAKRHLSWKTRVQNAADKEKHGTVIRGARHPGAKLTEDQVRAIRALRGQVSQRAAAKRFGAPHQTIGKIWRGQSWAWLDQ